MGQQHYIHFNVVSCVILHPTTIKYINSIIFISSDVYLLDFLQITKLKNVAEFRCGISKNGALILYSSSRCFVVVLKQRKMIQNT